MPKISVIVPIYNVESYLHRCVDSILAQTYQDFEIILIDDGSPDGCPQICDEYAAKDNRIHVIHQKNGGLSAARNSGIDWVFTNSDSDWLTFIDSDDWVFPEYLEYLFRAASENSTEISACDTFFAKEENFVRNSDGYSAEVLEPEDYWVKFGGYCSVAWEKLYKKELFESVRFPVGTIHEDEFTTHKIVFQTDKIAVVPNRLYVYFYGNGSIMRSPWNPQKIAGVEASLSQIAFFHKYGYSRAERIAKKKFEGSVLSNIDNINQDRKAFSKYKKQIFACVKEYLLIYYDYSIAVLPLTENFWILFIRLKHTFTAWRKAIRNKCQKLCKRK